MTVAELISRLKDLPQDMTVVVNLTMSELGNGWPVEKVIITKAVTNGEDYHKYYYEDQLKRYKTVKEVVDISS